MDKHQVARIIQYTLAETGPAMLEVDMQAIGPFAQAFAGPPTRQEDKE